MKKRVIVIICAALLMLTLACDMIKIAPTTSNPTETMDPQEFLDQAVSATMAANTAIAQAVQETLTAMMTDTPRATSTPTITPSPTFTLTPSSTSTASLTSTPSIPTITVSSNTNCRSGPGQSYELLGVLHPGEVTEIIGRTTVENYWLVRNPDSPTQICWLWGEYATPTGNWQALPIATQPFTPTPEAGFAVTYLGLVNCASDYALRFEFKNVGGTTWRSIKITLTDLVTSTTKTHFSDFFIDRTGCTQSNSLTDLEPNEVGYVVAASNGHFNYNPSGHEISIVIELFALDGLDGSSVSRTISVTP